MELWAPSHNWFLGPPCTTENFMIGIETPAPQQQPQAQRCFEQALEMSETPNPVPPCRCATLGMDHSHTIHGTIVYVPTGLVDFLWVKCR